MNSHHRSPAVPALFVTALAALAMTSPGARAADLNGGATAPTTTGASASPSKSPASATATTKPTATTRPAAVTAVTASGTPIITAVDCYRIGRTRCVKNHHVVQASGELVIHGHNLSRALMVYFPRAGATAASVEPLHARLRPTPHGFAVTVPVGAGSGHIYLRSPSGARSRIYGPLTIVAAPAAPTPTTPLAASAFDGPAMWVWYLDKSDGGNLASIAAAAKAAGVTTLFIKSSDGTNFWPQFTPALVQTFHALGLDVCAWQYVYGANPAGEAAMGAQAVADGADCLVVDAESSYDGNYYGAQTYIDDLRAAIGPNYPLGLSSFPYVDLHESVPYSVFLGPGGAQYDVPQVYWYAIGTTPDAAYAHTYIENRIYGRPIVPTGQTYGGVPAAEITRFRQLASAYGALGLSWWSWQATTSTGWTALDAPLTAGAAITIPTTWPTLSRGAKGDQVIWMQEHLATAEPATPITGTFDATTQTELEAFQAAEGLPQSGVTDAATWTALLALTPVVVHWPAPPPAGSTGASGSTGTSGTSGSSGATGTSGVTSVAGGTGASGGTGA